MWKATVSGSFHRHIIAIYDAVGQLREHEVDVLSPSDPRVVDHIGEFLFVASDRLRSIRLVQDRHLAAIKASDFLWVVCPDGYTGPSTSMEVGAAAIAGVPVFSTHQASDNTLGLYIRRVPSLKEALDTVAQMKRRPEPASILIDPDAEIEDTVDSLGDLRSALTGRSGSASEAERKLQRLKRRLVHSFSL